MSEWSIPTNRYGYGTELLAAKQGDERMEPAELDELTRAISNATRRTILRLCHPNETSAGDIAAEIDLALASVSEHLKVLRKTGLVLLERRGNHWLYTTNTERLHQLLAALSTDLPTKETSHDQPHRPLRDRRTG